MVSNNGNNHRLATKKWVVDRWEGSYQEAGSDTLTPWEMNPLGDLKAFMKGSNLRLKLVKSILEIGCGRALRSFILLLGCPPLNVGSLSYCGIDASKEAIGYCNAYLRELKEGTVPEFLAPYFSSAPSIKCRIQFAAGDVFRRNGLLEKSYDLVIDWMCFHELPQPPEAYAKLISRLADKFFVLKVFDSETSSQAVLTPVIPDVQKRQYSSDQIINLFQDFELEYSELEPENLNPVPRPKDGIIAAKRTYLFVRK